MVNLVKIGGAVIEDPQSFTEFLKSFAQIEGPKILVHGGGRTATNMAARLGVESKMIEGRRVTDDATLEVVTMVYGGLTNKSIVAKMQALGINALGLTGVDGNLIKANKRQHPSIDYGWVGDVEAVNADLLKSLLDAGVCPVLAPLTHDGKGSMLNTNADTIASATAVALAQNGIKTNLIYGFELKGVLRDFQDKNSVISKITRSDFEELKQQGVIADGMIPKLTNAFAAIEQGVNEVKICQALEVGEAVVKGSGTTLS